MIQSSALVTSPRGRSISYETFLKTYHGGEHVEWVEGKVVAMPPIGEGHTESLHILLSVLKAYVDHHDLGKLRSDPFQMKTGPSLPGRQPDLLFVAKRNVARLHKTYLDGPADVAVEIISPGSRLIDRVQKFQEYESGGIREYWLIDPERKVAEFYQLNRNGKYVSLETDDGVFQSKVIKGFWFKTEWLWSQPSLIAVLKEIGLV
jgi:Uma2 family endonuclease